ncbi:MAG: hypothetical protein JKX85_15355, partial [Phycisphaeraceae bacterium]|nr:hypothetical protein [Phycisphaeraceae bacterium]
MSRDRDYILDISSNPRINQQVNGATGQSSGNSLQGRPWLAVRWKCCQVYNRIYRTADGKSYKGNCPKCGKQV